MLAYAANRPVAGARSSSPNSLLVIFAAHVAALAALMSAKPDLIRRVIEPPITVVNVHPLTPPPKPTEPTRQTPRPQIDSTRPPVATPLPIPRDPTVAVPDPLPLPGPTDLGIPEGGGSGPVIEPPKPLPAPRVGPRLLTPSAELKPPYPQAKLLAEEEADLRLRLTIDDQGRVRSVDPIGRTDGEFLNAARRWLIAHWRYQPATEGGHAIGSTIDITLRFRLDD